MATLLERIGGEAAVTAAVDLFYKKILADSSLAPFFKDSNMDQQRKKQVSFLSSVMDGSAQNVETYMRNAHRPYVKDMGLNETHFGAVAGHLAATLDELGVAEDVSSEVMTAAAGLQDFVLDRGAAQAA